MIGTNSTRDILNSISEALRFPGFTIYHLIGALVIIVAIVLLAALLQRLINQRREDAALHERYEIRIRKLDLTIRQLDLLELLARQLNDRSKKYLLLTNRNTFRHCVAAAGALPPEQNVTLKSLEERLGFVGPEYLALALERFTPSEGSSVKIEQEGQGPMALAQVVTAIPEKLRLRLESNPGLVRGATVSVWAKHPSGLVVAQGVLDVVDRNETVITITRPFAQPENTRVMHSALEVFVKAEEGSGEPVATKMRSLWPTGAILENPSRVFRKRDDLQIVFRRDHARWVWVNAEVVALKRRRRVMKVRFSHLAPEQRKSILGVAG